MVILVHTWLVDANKTISGHFLWEEMGAALTRHGQSSQSANFWKTAKMAHSKPCMKFEIFLSQITLFDMLWIVPLVNLSKKCIRLHPSARGMYDTYVVVHWFRWQMLSSKFKYWIDSNDAVSRKLPLKQGEAQTWFTTFYEKRV